MFNKKSIVLNGVEDNSKRAVLTFECDGEITRGIVRLYNFSSEPRGIISLGIYHDGNVVKAGLTHVEGMVFSFVCQIPFIPKKFSCAVINFLDGDPKPILYGNSEGYGDQEKLFEEVISSLSKTKNVEEVENVLDEHNIDLDDELKEEIEKNIDDCLQEQTTCEDCETCQYKKFYFQSIQVLEDKPQEEETLEEICEEKNGFYKELKEQIDLLFADNPNEDYLEKLIPNSKWVKVSIENSEEYYVLGLIYNEDRLVYICYGVPGVYQKTAPRELSGYPVWFPLDENKPQGFGYWLSYQDAQSGESVKAVIV